MFLCGSSFCVTIFPSRSAGYHPGIAELPDGLGDVLPGAGDVRVFLNVYNLFDTVYVQDAVDNSRFNAYSDNGGHDADSAEVFLGYPRNLNIGFQFNFR